MAKYAAFLRGINVGGPGRTVKMEPLRKAFEDCGYENVKTLLASGNVVFETKEVDQKSLRANIEAGLKRVFGIEISVILRSVKEMRALVKENPFKNVKVTPKTRLYITFLSEPAKSNLKTPYKSLKGDYKILDVTKGHIVSVLDLSAGSGTVQAMDILEKEFGTNITTRNWNTVQKVAKTLEDSSD